MTQDEIIKMEGGVEMDKLVAVYVFGVQLQLGGYEFGHSLPGGPFKAVGLGADGMYFRYIPAYSTDISAAWQVVKKICIDPPNDCWTGPTMQINYHIEDSKECHVVFEYLDSLDWYVGKHDWVEARADTIPLAICRAALLATVGVD